MATGGRNFSPLFPHRPRSPGCHLTPALLPIDSPELGPGAILGPAGTSSVGTSSVGTSTTYPSSSLAQLPAPSTIVTASQPSYTVGGASNTTTSGPSGYKAAEHSSNTGAIAGGTVAGVAAISVVVVAMFFYRQRRRSLAQSAPSTGDGQAGVYYQHVNEVPSRPMSGHETVTSSLPGTSGSLFRTYVRSRAPTPLAFGCSCVSPLFPTHRTRRTELRSPGTKDLRTRLSPLLKHLPYRTPEIYTP
jgi:hypothetical protein